MSNIIDFGQFKQEKSEKEAVNAEVRAVLSSSMESLYVSMFRQTIKEATDGALDGLGSLSELGLSEESAAEVMLAVAEEFRNAAEAAEYVADHLRGEDD